LARIGWSPVCWARQVRKRRERPDYENDKGVGLERMGEPVDIAMDELTRSGLLFQWSRRA